MNNEQLIRNFVRKLLFEAFEFSNNDSFIPTHEIQKVAERAKSVLEQMKASKQKIESGDDKRNEGSGKRKVEDLIQVAPQSFPEMKRLYAFFENNAIKVAEERKKFKIFPQQKGSEEEMTKSPFILIWNLHGGDPCYNWVREKLDSKHKENLKTKERIRAGGGAGKNKGMGSLDITMMDPTKIRIHR